MQTNESFSLAGMVTICADGELRASTLVLAHGLAQQHAAVIKLARRHLADLEQLGGVGFEVQPFATKGGTQHREVAMLNEHQATLLIAMMRNTKQVIRFKIGLVKEFFRMREELGRSERNLWQQMQALISKEVGSQVRASFGSHLMLERKRELPSLRDERHMLENLIQPSLLN
ncbi:MAG: Rha family transcriptional regulator [Pseudomonadota bacterium]